MIIDVDDSLPGKERKKQIMRQYLIYALALNGSIRNQTAKWMGMKSKTLRYWLEQFPDISARYQSPYTAMSIESRLRHRLPKTLDQCTQTNFWKYADESTRTIVRKLYDDKKLETD
jgi:hypothetical protein